MSEATAAEREELLIEIEKYYLLAKKHLMAAVLIDL
jgi:hypothetical protein